jgi:hypothetical protein
MKIIITEEQNKKLFIPRKLSSNDSRYSEWNNSQPMVDGVRINQYDYEGNKEGYWEEYRSNGNLWVKGSYVNGKEDGYWEVYYDNGRLMSKGNYKDGDREGYWEYYYDNGNFYFTGNYKNGNLVEDLPLTECKVYNYKIDDRFSDPDDEEIIYKFTNVDGFDFEVSFFNIGDNNWEREYRTVKKGLSPLNTNDAYNIIETTTKITVDFIRKYQPNNVYIQHIPSRRESKLNNVNWGEQSTKRAILNKKYLQPAINQLDNYYYKLIGSKSIISKLY